MVFDTVLAVNQAVGEGLKVLVEGANAAMLDIDFGGSTSFIDASSWILTTGLSLCPLPWGHNFRYLSICDIVNLHSWRSVHGTGYPSEEHWFCPWSVQSLHYQSWRRGFAN